MKYRILNQGIGVAASPLPEDVEKSLLIEIDGAEGEVIKLVSEDHVSYAKVEDGVAAFDRSELVGRVELSLIRAAGTVPLGGFICVPTDNGVRLYQDAEHLLSRLAKVERDISDALAMHRAIEAKCEDILKRIERLFTGYSF